MSKRKTIHNLLRRGTALLLSLCLLLTAQVQALASGYSDDMAKASAKGSYTMQLPKRDAERSFTAQDSKLYYQLLKEAVSNGSDTFPGFSASSGSSAAFDFKEPGTLSDEAGDWTDTVMKEAKKAGIDGLIDKTKDKAVSDFHSAVRLESTDDAVKFFDIVENAVDNLGSFFGICDAAELLPSVFELQGDTVASQLAELAVLTAQFGIAAFSVIGLSVSFPWGIILSFILELLLDAIRSGILDDILEKDTSKEAFDKTRYRLPDGTNVYKPNIYLYSDTVRSVTVAFDEPELLTASIPDYTGSWKVTVSADGTLTDASGESYNYLFYESLTEPAIFQTEEGWHIPADTREEDLRAVLAELNFNEQETQDFLEFWVDMLEDGTDYIMYPQDTALVDTAMPITVTDEPESLERIWFAFTEDEGQSVTEPTGYELIRGGTDCGWYVIEWGGFFLEG